MVWSQGNVATCPAHIVQMHNSTRAGQWTRRATDNQCFLQGSPIVLPGMVQFIFLKIYPWTQLSVHFLLPGERCSSTFARIFFLSFSSLVFALWSSLWVELHKLGNLTSFHHQSPTLVCITSESQSPAGFNRTLLISTEARSDQCKELGQKAEADFNISYFAGRKRTQEYLLFLFPLLIGTGRPRTERC